MSIKLCIRTNNSALELVGAPARCKEWTRAGESSLVWPPALYPASSTQGTDHRKANTYTPIWHPTVGSLLLSFRKANFTWPFAEDECDSFSLLRAMWWPDMSHTFNWVMSAHMPVVPTRSHLMLRRSVKALNPQKQLDGRAQTRSAVGGQRDTHCCPLSHFPLSPTQTPPRPSLSLHACISRLVKSGFKCTSMIYPFLRRRLLPVSGCRTGDLTNNPHPELSVLPTFLPVTIRFISCTPWPLLGNIN